MTQKSFGCVGVVNKSKQIVGIITDGDLRRKLNSKLFDKKASEIMTKKPTLANKNMLVGEAINLMNTKKITSLFICDKKVPLGIVFAFKSFLIVSISVSSTTFSAKKSAVT